MLRSYKAVTLTQEALEKLDWWITSMDSCNRQSVSNQEQDLIKESDASQLGWGGGTHTGGLWSPTERQTHINRLGLKAAVFAVRAFSGNRRDTHIHQLDNCGVYKQQGRYSISSVAWLYYVPMQCRTLCNMPESLVPSVCQLEARPIHDQLGQMHFGYHGPDTLPPFTLISNMLRKVQEKR